MSERLSDFFRRIHIFVFACYHFSYTKQNRRINNKIAVFRKGIHTFLGTRLPIAKVAWLACASKTIVIVGAFSVRMATVRVEVAFVDI